MTHHRYTNGTERIRLIIALAFFAGAVLVSLLGCTPTPTPPSPIATPTPVYSPISPPPTPTP